MDGAGAINIDTETQSGLRRAKKDALQNALRQQQETTRTNTETTPRKSASTVSPMEEPFRKIRYADATKPGCIYWAVKQSADEREKSTDPVIQGQQDKSYRCAHGDYEIPALSHKECPPAVAKKDMVTAGNEISYLLVSVGSDDDPLSTLKDEERQVDNVGSNGGRPSTLKSGKDNNSAKYPVLQTLVFWEHWKSRKLTQYRFRPCSDAAASEALPALGLENSKLRSIRIVELEDEDEPHLENKGVYDLVFHSEGLLEERFVEFVRVQQDTDPGGTPTQNSPKASKGITPNSAPTTIHKTCKAVRAEGTETKMSLMKIKIYHVLEYQARDQPGRADWHCVRYKPPQARGSASRASSTSFLDNNDQLSLLEGNTTVTEARRDEL